MFLLEKEVQVNRPLLLHFMKNGYPLLSDDVIAISLLDEEKPWVIPSYPQQKLWQDSLNHFGMKTTNYMPLFDRETKYSIPVAKQFYNKPLPLGGIFELVPSDIEQIEVEQILNLKRFQTVFTHTYRHSLNRKDEYDRMAFSLFCKMYQACTALSITSTILNIYYPGSCKYSSSCH